MGDFHYFSNGTEGEIWMRRWCRCCSKDHGMHGEGFSDPNCPLVTTAMLHEEVVEWTDTSEQTGGFPSVVCSAFDQCEDVGCNADPRRDEEGRTFMEWAAMARDKMRLPT